ncbi:MAG: hypothetical protein ACFE0P_02990 [Oceanicaulis sp.]
MAIISHRYRFIFIKTQKTAGTAIEVTLSPLCGPDDVVTPIIPTEPGHTPRNYRHGDGDFYNHMPASEIRDRIGVLDFNAYFKFCVERDPVEKCLSHYAMLKHSPHHVRLAGDVASWDRYVARGRFPIDRRIYTGPDGSLLVDRVLNYERLEQELHEVMDSLGVPWTGLKSNAKSGFRAGGVPRLEDVTEVQASAIRKAFDSFPRAR